MRYCGVIEFHPADGDKKKILHDVISASSLEDAKQVFEKTWYRNANILLIEQQENETGEHVKHKKDENRHGT